MNFPRCYDDCMSEAAIERALHEARNLRRHATQTQARAEEATEEAAIAALKAGYSSARIMRELGIAESRMRAIRTKNGIGPDPRYAHLRPPVPGKKENPS